MTWLRKRYLLTTSSIILPWKAATTGVFEGILALVVGIASEEVTKLRRAIVNRVRRETYIIGPYLWRLTR